MGSQGPVSDTHLGVYKRQVDIDAGFGQVGGKGVAQSVDTAAVFNTGGAASRVVHAPVSYTHLDVYKRQATLSMILSGSAVSFAEASSSAVNLPSITRRTWFSISESKRNGSESC